MSRTPLSIEQERSSIAAPGERQLTDIEKQQEYEIGLRRQTGASIAGIVTGAIVDPTNLVGFTAKTITKGMLQLGSLGALTGAVEPVYEEFGDDRLTNIAIGTGVAPIVLHPDPSSRVLDQKLISVVEKHLFCAIRESSYMPGRNKPCCR